LIELMLQTRPKAIFRWLFHKDKKLRKAMSWYNNIGKRVWLYEWIQFFFHDNITRRPIPITEFWK
jgi:anaerobic magnesium-protoporphyrin IX monomethyl ester cyclase